MKIIDRITNEIIVIDDFYDALREAKSRVKFYNETNRPARIIEEFDRIIIEKDKDK